MDGVLLQKEVRFFSWDQGVLFYHKFNLPALDSFVLNKYFFMQQSRYLRQKIECSDFIPYVRQFSTYLLRKGRQHFRSFHGQNTKTGLSSIRSSCVIFLHVPGKSSGRKYYRYSWTSNQGSTQLPPLHRIWGEVKIGTRRPPSRWVSQTMPCDHHTLPEWHHECAHICSTDMLTQQVVYSLFYVRTIPWFWGICQTGVRSSGWCSIENAPSSYF